MTDEITQAEKRQILKDSYLSRAQADADLGGGRFRKVTETRVTGVPEYPAQPSSSPWASDPVPPELPIGYEIDEVVGASSPGSMAPSDAFALSSDVEPAGPTSSSSSSASKQEEEEGAFSSKDNANER